MKKHMVGLFLSVVVLSGSAQQKEIILQYIEQYKDIAIDEMVRAKVPASITLAQGLLETGAGTSTLCLKSNNHFGIKCKEEWSGGKYYHDDDKPKECFRVYGNARESYKDHSDFLASRKWYAPLFQLPITSYKYWAYGLKEAGYATHPQYATLLIKYIEDYKLFEYDNIGIAKMEEKEKGILAQKEVTPTEVVTVNSKSVNENKPTAHHTEMKKAASGRQEYVINGTRAVKAVGNEDPLTIAFEYNIDYSWVMLFNDMSTGDKFKDGQYIYLQNKKPKGAEVSVTVLRGESMHDVSQRTGVKLRNLYYINAMRPNDQAHAGEVLSLQEKRAQSPRTMSYAEYLRQQAGTNQQTQNEPRTTGKIDTETGDLPRTAIIKNMQQYQVQQTDTLHEIASKFNTTVEQLKEWNGLASADLRAGQTLVVAK